MTEQEEKMKKWIDEASYEDLLRRWRNAPIGDPFFQGDVGEYYSQVMFKKKSELSDNGVEASKNVGFTKP